MVIFPFIDELQNVYCIVCSVQSLERLESKLKKYNVWK